MCMCIFQYDSRYDLIYDVVLDYDGSLSLFRTAL